MISPEPAAVPVRASIRYICAEILLSLEYEQEIPESDRCNYETKMRKWNKNIQISNDIILLSKKEQGG